MHLQPLADRRDHIFYICFNCRRRQAVSHNHQHFWMTAAGFTDDIQCFTWKSSSQIRTGQIFILIFTECLHKYKITFFDKLFRYITEHRILGCRMIRPDTKHGCSTVSGTCFSYAKPCRRFCFHRQISGCIFGILYQKLLAQIDFRNVLQTSSGIFRNLFDQIICRCLYDLRAFGFRRFSRI